MKKNSFGRQLFVALFIIFVFLFSAETSNACSCAVSQAVNLAYQQTPNIVVLRVQSVEKYQEGEPNPNGSLSKQSKLIVEKVYKGNLKIGQELTFGQGVCCICIWGFSEEMIGQDYLFYLSEKPDKDGVWYGSVCSRSNSVKNASADLLYLEKIEKVRGKTRLSGILQQDIKSYVEGEDSDYKRLANKTVRVVGMGKNLKLKTDENGVFEIYELSAGKYRIIPEKIRGYTFWNEDGFRVIEIKDGSHTEANFIYEIDNSISGKFIDVAGKPLKNVCLNLVSVSGKKLPYNFKLDCTDENGRFKIDEIPTGTYVIIVNDDGKITAEEPFGTFYYPNTTKIENAAKITIGAGDFFSDFVITAPDSFETITISGVVSFEKGRIPTKENYEYVSVEFVADESENKLVNGKTDYNSRTIVDETGRFTIRILKGQKGKLFGEMMGFTGEYENCPKLDKLFREVKDESNSTVKTNSIEVEAVNEMNGVELKFPFPSCKKAKI